MRMKMIAAFLALILAASVMSACGRAEKEDSPSQPPTGESVTGQQTEPETPESDPTDYRRLSAIPFENLKECPADQFEVRENADGVTVTGYTGNERRVRIPEIINGKPVNGLGNDAFKDRKNMTVLYVPDSVTDFGTGILIGCESLYALHTPLPLQEGKQFLGYLYGAEIYQKNNMPDLRNLDFLELGGTLTELPEYALYDCNDLVCVTLPESMTSLAAFSLYRCESLKYINTERLERIASHAMDHCSALEELVFSDRLLEIGQGAIENCLSLHRLTVPFAGGSLTGNGWLAYLFGASAPEFSKGFYPPSLREVKILSGCESIGDYAFYECVSLRTIELPESISAVGMRAFSGCARMESLVLPDSVKNVREYAFSGCSSMRSVTFGTALNRIGIGAFSGCTALTEVTLPGMLKALPDSCFAGCTSLQRVGLGGVSTVGKNVFYRCDAIFSVESAGNVSFAEGNDVAKHVWQNVSH